MVARIFLLGVLFFGSAEFALADAPPITKVTSSLYRGRRPDEATIAKLAKMNVKTILDLENDEAVVNEEIAVAHQYDMQVISTPMSGFWRPRETQINSSLQILAAATEAAPVFIHCQHGQDRTGLIVGLFRVKFEHWAPPEAYKEMVANGFHPSLIFLKQYFEDETGFHE